MENSTLHFVAIWRSCYPSSSVIRCSAGNWRLASSRVICRSVGNWQLTRIVSWLSATFVRVWCCEFFRVEELLRWQRGNSREVRGRLTSYHTTIIHLLPCSREDRATPYYP